MSAPPTNEGTPSKPLRVWPGVVAVLLLGFIRFVVPLFVPDAAGYAVLAGIALGLVVLLWWLFFSRARWADRLGAIVLMVLALIVTKRLVHPSIAGGMMGMLLFVYAIPVLSLSLVTWAVLCGRFSPGLRYATLATTVLIASGIFLLLRTDGIIGDASSEFHWRWTPTPEERLLARTNADKARDLASRPPAPGTNPSTQNPEQPKSPASVPTAAPAPDPGNWPGFRGPERDGVVRGGRIETNWSRSMPAELWRRPVGPAWSSIAVYGDFLFTQEQLGEDELVSCYRLGTGEPVWKHSDAVRFYESNAGPGPRGTPSVHQGRVYSLGATGLLNALDARDGSVVWSRNAASDTQKKIPGWGFSGSPLVVGDEILVATAGVLAAYDLATGKLRWVGPAEGGGYSSPHLATIAGVPQVLLLSTTGAIGVAPSDGALLWKHEWGGDGVVQPAVIAGSDVLLGSGSGLGGKVGLRRISVAHPQNGWSVEERWTSIGLKPYFNDFVIHRDHAYGIDGSLLACVDLVDGKRRWKGGRYGHGQLVALAAQDLLLVLSETGEVALVAATPDQFTEVAQFKAIQGKTWNHPVVVGEVLLVRNDREMAAFRLTAASR